MVSFFEKMDNREVFIIAEVGNNHQGDLDTALKYVDEFALAGANAIKFQTRNNRYLFDETGYNKKYESHNAFAPTYGAHREAVELSRNDLVQLKQRCEERGVKFMSTPFDEKSLDLLIELKCDIVKLASFDLGNLSFMNRVADSGLSVVMSVGGGDFDQIKASVELFQSRGVDLSVLHCVSEYPCKHDRLGLENLPILLREFPRVKIGLSDHFSGILSGPIGYVHGARVFEKHVTINRAWKGTDHSFSLELEGFQKFVRDIKRTPEMWNSKPKDDLGKEFVFQKLGKSLCAYADIRKGDIITLDNIRGRIFENEGLIPVKQTHKVLGKKVNRDIVEGGAIMFNDLSI
jgi:sialic acid synthase